MGPGAAQFKFLFIKDDTDQKSGGVEILSVAGGAVNTQQSRNTPSGTAFMGRKTFKLRRNKGYKVFTQQQGGLH